MVSFAIVIPNLNQSHFLASALESLRHQSVPFELAVMDGGSSDGFHRIIEPYRDIITHVRSGPDNGQAAAIREGIEHISGDIIAWLNADDYYFPGALDKVASYFENAPELDVVYGDAIHVSPEGFFLMYFPAIQAYNAKALPGSCFICQPACFVRRRAYEKTGGIDSTLNYTMDWDLWCRLSKEGANFRYFNDVLVAVRYHPDTKTLSRDRKRYREIYVIAEKYGHRYLPLSLLGFYYFDLSAKAVRSIPENIAFLALRFLRYLKKRFFAIFCIKSETSSNLYGFRRWESRAEGRCTIQMPWYEKQDWKRLRLDVYPKNAEYRIIINDDNEVVSSAVQGYLLIDMPDIDQPYRKISIECLSSFKWKLLKFSCEFK
jgi:glycosyltransferase involved in cell wall biosynthesis